MSEDEQKALVRDARKPHDLKERLAAMAVGDVIFAIDLAHRIQCRVSAYARRSETKPRFKTRFRKIEGEYGVLVWRQG